LSYASTRGVIYNSAWQIASKNLPDLIDTVISAQLYLNPDQLSNIKITFM